MSAGFFAFRSPKSRSPWFPVSTSEWMPSAIIAAEPVIPAATNLVTEMSPLPIRAA